MTAVCANASSTWRRNGQVAFPGTRDPAIRRVSDCRTLLEGQTYFRVAFVDKQMRIPELTPSVFIGRNLAEGDTDAVYFQDAASYLEGIRFGDGNESGEYHTVDAGTPFVDDFERALDQLLYCSLTRGRQR
jgi:hypothetical protein